MPILEFSLIQPTNFPMFQKKQKQINKEQLRENNKPQTARVVVISSSQVYCTEGHINKSTKRVILTSKFHINATMEHHFIYSISPHLPAISCLPRQSPIPILCPEHIKTEMPINQSHLFSIEHQSIYRKTEKTKIPRAFYPTSLMKPSQQTQQIHQALLNTNALLLSTQQWS